MRQWFLWQMDPSTTAYHMCGGLKLRGRLDVARLRQALQAVVDHHPSLRTTFHAGESGEVWQRVHPQLVLDVPLLDMTAGNLSTHLSKLEGAGYVQQNKTYSGRSPATYLALTPEGRVAFERYVRNLRALLDA